MSKITRNTLLKYIPNHLDIENIINPARIYKINNHPIKSGSIFYLCEREIRAKDNFALQFVVQKSKELNLPFKIIHPKQIYEHTPKQNFIDNQIKQAQKIFQTLNLDFEITIEKPSEIIRKTKPAILIVDFNPILKRNYLNNVDCKIYEIDGHNIIPARYISNKQEYSAATMRKKIYYNIYSFLTQYSNITQEKVEADFVLEDFIKNKLPYYSELKNNSSANVTSDLSKYLNLGFISSQRVALEVIKSDVSDDNKETFLEELVVRKELADNFCLYAKNFSNFSSISSWANLSLESHKSDLRNYVYSLKELENAQTHDKLWNAAQVQLRKEGKIHGYLRMYWAKKFLEWTLSPKEALYSAIYLNDKYAYDAPSSNGYVGILWAIGGLHDRAFKDFPVTGKIRRMTYDSIRRKYSLNNYINKHYPKI